ncbi:phosphoribosyltransferase [Methanolobus bombayensis]|uniref:phosphoribosyltransferase n=1 Tax=Methanolobus bombayensis TaxID=38023 RepID=UPI001AE698A4|nr:phosphoribosyltransferase [Methanolobus bombayensis]MBP1908305.1 hypothetical protein [Methanolobus bombayensis]
MSKCTIFVDDYYNRMATFGDILNFGTYQTPRRGYNPNPYFDDFSQHILNVKKSSKETDLSERSKISLSFFLYKFELILDFCSEYTICVMPSSEAGLQDSGIRQIASMLAEYPYYANCDCEESLLFTFADVFVESLEYEVDYLIRDGTDVLHRTKTVTPKHLGGRRGDINYEMESLDIIEDIIDEDLIRGKQVLLLDDIATSGASLKAGKELLLEAGARIVIPFALGETWSYRMKGRQIDV